VAVLANGTFAWTSDSQPAGSNPDITQVRESNLEGQLDNGDVVLADRGYQGLSIPCCIPYKRQRTARGAPRAVLDPNQLLFNEIQSEARYLIEFPSIKYSNQIVNKAICRKALWGFETSIQYLDSQIQAQQKILQSYF
jgi:DDE superfamily endonuclease